MHPRVAVLALVVALAGAAYPILAAAPAPPTTRAVTLEVTAAPCGTVEDGVCLAYNGVTPGPTLDVDLGDTIVITLVNRIAETLPSGAPAHLATAPVSWHVHGTALSPAEDGVLAHPGTQLVSSVAEPGGSFTYTVRATYVGAWHYHDHVLGPDGSEGVERGLYGGLVVRSGAEVRPEAVVDLHMLDDGGHTRAPIPTLQAGDDLELLVVGLENILWNVQLRDPSGAILATVQSGPGLSERILVEDVAPGTYTWRATGAGTKTGAVAVVTP